MQSTSTAFHKIEFTMHPKLYAFYEKIAKRQKLPIEKVMEEFLEFWAEKGVKSRHFDASINPFMSEHKLESIEKSKAKNHSDNI